MAVVQAMIQVALLSDLKLQPVSTDARIFVAGITSMDDGLGGFYRWDATSTTTEDLVYFNVIKSNLFTTGRWIRIFQRTRNVPQGVLVTNGGVKTLFVNTVTDSNGEAKINLTTDNTPTGPSIFTEVWNNTSFFKGSASSPTGAVESYVKVTAESTNLKTTTHGFYKGNSQVINLGLLFNALISAGANIPVVFEIVGI